MGELAASRRCDPGRPRSHGLVEMQEGPRPDRHRSGRPNPGAQFV